MGSIGVEEVLKNKKYCLLFKCLECIIRVSKKSEHEENREE